MTRVNYPQLGEQILEEVGGESNISSVTHCATRLRFKIKDDGKVNAEAIEALPGVVTTVKAGGQFQVVVGNDVPAVYAGIGAVTNLTQSDAADTSDDGPKGNLVSRFIELISSLFTPILWPLAGVGLFKAFLYLFATVGWVDTESSTYTILYAASDGLLYFLPLFLAVTSARRFKANQFTSMAIASALVYPSIVALAEVGEPVTFLGIPVAMMSYTSSVIPIIVAVWVQGYLERFLDKACPAQSVTSLPHW